MGKEITSYQLFKYDKPFGKIYPNRYTVWISCLERGFVVEGRGMIWLPDKYKIKEVKDGS
mgnify:CR=1 FL=1